MKRDEISKIRVPARHSPHSWRRWSTEGRTRATRGASGLTARRAGARAVPGVLSAAPRRRLHTRAATVGTCMAARRAKAQSIVHTMVAHALARSRTSRITLSRWPRLWQCMMHVLSSSKFLCSSSNACARGKWRTPLPRVRGREPAPPLSWRWRGPKGLDGFRGSELALCYCCDRCV